ncbi:MAG: CBS domain-containing protein [Cytophagales bacterium]|nr:CBS domain-containing protein [Cytophagales bacterium]
MSIENEFVKNLMTANIHSVSPDQELAAVQNIMEQNSVGHLPVIENEKLIGMISMTDIKRMRYLSEFTGKKVSEKTVFVLFDIKEAMTSPVVSVDVNTTVMEVSKIFSASEYHALPVMKDEEVVGILSMKDILKYFIKNISQ